jgi:phosphonate transport system ATP-binding protein
MSGAALRVSGLSKRYGDHAVLRDVSLAVAPGEFVVLFGPSGAGKTTLFRCIGRLARPDAGEIHAGDAPLHALEGGALMRARRSIGVIFQQFNLIRRTSALDNVLTGRLGHVPAWRAVLRRFSRDDRALALSCLDRVGLLPHAHRRADRLSGGQQQRAAIARALAQGSRVILADEPIGSLDPDNAANVLSLLKELAHERGIAVLCSLHQVELARRYADRIVMLDGGRIVASGG